MRTTPLVCSGCGQENWSYDSPGSKHLSCNNNGTWQEKKGDSLAFMYYLQVRDWALKNGWVELSTLHFQKGDEVKSIPELHRMMTGEEKNNEG